MGRKKKRKLQKKRDKRNRARPQKQKRRAKVSDSDSERVSLTTETRLTWTENLLNEMGESGLTELIKPALWLSVPFYALLYVGCSYVAFPFWLAAILAPVILISIVIGDSMGESNPQSEERRVSMDPRSRAERAAHKEASRKRAAQRKKDRKIAQERSVSPSDIESPKELRPKKDALGGPSGQPFVVSSFED